MGRFVLEADQHYHARPPLSVLPWIGARSMTRSVTFGASCAYPSAAYNSQDVNKLFGLSFGFGGVHNNSARFGWRWSMADQCIELLAYCYVNGVRNQDEQLRFPVVARVQPGQKVYCGIRKDARAYEFFCNDGQTDNPEQVVRVPAPSSLPGYGLTHGLYFGGALTCPHRMSVQIDRV